MISKKKKIPKKLKFNRKKKVIASAVMWAILPIKDIPGDVFTNELCAEMSVNTKDRSVKQVGVFIQEL